ncbi:MAG: response regulator transcription factor, partial [Roseibium sp.]|nr:response regulator transcription factor [Roseibium sp.]
MSATSYRFIIADDHPLFRGALRQTLETQYPDATILEAGALEDVTSRLEQDGDIDLI